MKNNKNRLFSGVRYKLSTGEGCETSIFMSRKRKRTADIIDYMEPVKAEWRLK